ncbi:MAG: rod shape-determining protein [Butyricicoccus sp.]
MCAVHHRGGGACRRAGTQAGAKRVSGQEPVAAAIGAGIDINRANGNLVVDIGGATDVAVISLGGIVRSTSIKVAGVFDKAIVKYVRRKHNALIGDRTAEEIKRTVGCVYPRSEEAIMEVRGRCLMTGLPRTFTVSSSEILDALEEVSSAIVEAVHWVLERTPPELTGDISANGITMTGGGSLIWGFDKLIASKTGIPTRVADEAVSCVAYGTGNCLENLSKMQDGTMNLSRQRQMKAR